MLPKISHMFRLTKDAVCNYTNSGVAITELSLMSSKKYGENEYKVFLPGKSFKKTAELLAQVKKGQRIYVSGELQTETWESNGQTQYKTVLYINEFEFVEKRENNNQLNQQQNQNYQQQGNYHQQGNYQQPSQPQGQPSFQGPQGDQELPF